MDTDVWRQRIRVFSEEREWGAFHDPKNLVMALSVEAAELVEIFQWMTPEESRVVMGGERRQDVADEVADVMTYLLRLADVLDLDLEAAMASKAERNAKRYPRRHRTRVQRQGARARGPRRGEARADRGDDAGARHRCMQDRMGRRGAGAGRTAAPCGRRANRGRARVAGARVAGHRRRRHRHPDRAAGQHHSSGRRVGPQGPARQGIVRLHDAHASGVCRRTPGSRPMP